MKFNKKNRLALAGVALAAILTVGGSLAYFTDTDTRTNVMTLGKVEGTLTESTDEENTTTTETGIEYNDPIMPGQSVSKKPIVSTTSDSESAYARVKVTVEGTYADGSTIPAAELAKIAFNYNTTAGWNLSTDGYVYYNTALTAGQSTPEVFTTVTFPSEWNNDFANASVRVIVTGELIQADNFTPTSVSGIITSWGSVDIKAAN